jgi:hypothetical protein
LSKSHEINGADIRGEKTTILARRLAFGIFLAFTSSIERQPRRRGDEGTNGRQADFLTGGEN